MERAQSAVTPRIESVQVAATQEILRRDHVRQVGGDVGVLSVVAVLIELRTAVGVAVDAVLQTVAPVRLAREEFWMSDDDEAQDADVAADLTDMIASKNLLGGGDLDRLYPRGDRALRALHACETAWRIAL